MGDILDSLREHEVRRLDAGQFLIRQNENTGTIYFLIEGAVEVLKGDVRVATASEPGAVFGEMAVMLGAPHTACVRALKPSTFYAVTNPRKFLKTSPAVCLHICELMAHRIDDLSKHLVNVKHQFEGHDQIGVVDDILDRLMHRHPVSRHSPG